MDKYFDLLSYSIAFRKPRRLTDVDHWHPHIPFCFVIMAMLKPARFVELGTWKGDSYCAFCQAVDELGLNTACYAIDNWQGDEHAGLYGEEVFEELCAYHDPLYGVFSRLTKCFFDDALDYFTETSIDLLHIDGHHSYDSVKHDFESWLPKMSNRGVVLFHDTNVREMGFGVWRLWHEIRDLYPSFEFRFGHGLGVLAVGENVEKNVRTFLDRAKKQGPDLESLFFNLGRNTFLSTENKKILRELNHLRKITVQEQEQIHARDAAIQEQEQQIHAKDAAIQEQEQQIHAKDAHIGNLETVIQDKDTHVSNLLHLLKGKDQYITGIAWQLKEKDQHIGNLESAIRDRETALNNIYNSYGWKTLLIYYRIRDKMLPPDSVRRRVIRKIFKPFKQYL